MNWEQLELSGLSQEFLLQPEKIPAIPPLVNELYLCIGFDGRGKMALFVPNEIENRERIVKGLSDLNWVSGNDPLFYFPSREVQRMIYLTSNFVVRWGKPVLLAVKAVKQAESKLVREMIR